LFENFDDLNARQHTLHRITPQFKQDTLEDGRLRPSSATWLTGRNIRIFFDSCIFLPWKHDVIHKTGSTWHIALPSEHWKQDRATAIG